MFYPDISTQLPETVLIDKTIRGDLDSFNQLVLKYQNICYNHAYSLLGDPASAEDATQEGFIKAFRHIGQFRGGSFQAWLLRIVANTAYDILRQQKRHSVVSLNPETNDGQDIESPHWIADPSPSLQCSLEQKEYLSTLYQMMDELPDVYRSVLNLIDLNELDYQEAATTLNVPVGTIKSRLARARMQMKEKLQYQRIRPDQTQKTDICLVG